MSKLLSTLSLLLTEDQPYLTALDVEELLGTHQHFLLDAKVIVPTRPASYVVCDACHLSHIEEVVRVKSHNGRVYFRIPCEESGWVDVPGERLQQWILDVGRFVAMVGAAIEAGSSPNELVRGLAWQIGTIKFIGETFVVVFIRPSVMAVETLLAELEKTFPQPRTILVGIDLPPDVAINFAASLPLTSAFTVTEYQFEFQLARIQTLISARSIVNGNVFQRQGELWQLSFDGDTTFLKDSVGLEYIARLLIEPDREIPAVTMLAARVGIDPLVMYGSLGEVLDDQARDQYGRRYRDLQAELREAKEYNELGQIAKLEVEMEQLTNELVSATGLGGRSRKTTDIEKVRKSVSMAVSRDIERIGKHHEKLGRHLIATIHSGLTFRYAPQQKIQWLT